MRKVTLTCDYPRCENPPVARAYVKVTKRYSKTGERLPGPKQESLGSADFCRGHFDALSEATQR